MGQAHISRDDLDEEYYYTGALITSKVYSWIQNTICQTHEMKQLKKKEEETREKRKRQEEQEQKRKMKQIKDAQKKAHVVGPAEDLKIILIGNANVGKSSLIERYKLDRDLTD